MVNGSYFFYWNPKFGFHWREKKGLVTLHGLKFKGCQYKMKKIKLLKKDIFRKNRAFKLLIDSHNKVR